MSTLSQRRRHVAGLLIFTLIMCSFVAGISNGHIPTWPAGILAWLSGLLLFADVSRFQKIQVAIMSFVGIACLLFASWRGYSDYWLALISGNQALLAMLATVSFLRMVTPPPGQESLAPRGPVAVVQTLFATHLFAAVVNISSVFVVGHRISTDGSLTPLQAKVVSRGFVTAACWSPLFASMAVVLLYVPGVDMLSVSRANLLFALAMLLVAAVSLRKDPEAAEFIGYPLRPEALVLPLVLMTTMLCYAALPTGWPILTTIVAAAASAVICLSFKRSSTENRQHLNHHIANELPRMAGEFALFLGAGLFAIGLGSAVASLGFEAVIDPSGWTQLFGLLVVLVVLSLAGFHPVIGISTMAGFFPPILSNPDHVAIIVLMAWSIALGTSPLSGTTLAMQGRFGIPATRFFGWNIRFSLSGLVIAALLLGWHTR